MSARHGVLDAWWTPASHLQTSCKDSLCHYICTAFLPWQRWPASCECSTSLTVINPSRGKRFTCRTAGVIKRVAGLLVAGVVLGTVLFYVGLKLAFPDYT